MAASPTPPTADRWRVAVAASGGRDSTALLHCTARAAQALGGQVVALHVHHGLHPDADAWQRHLTRQCARWARAGLPVVLMVQRLAGRPAPGDSIEAWARRERYAALASLAQTAGCRSVLLAHHRRDQAETVLLQVLRGGGPQALAAMPAAADRDGLRWLRPWRDHPRRAIEAYVRRHRLRYVDDGSNADERFARNRLRHRVWPALAAAFPDAEAALALAAQRAHEAAACLQALAAIDAAACVADDRLLRTPWLALPPPRRANLLRHVLGRWCGRGVPDTLVQRLLAELPRCPAGHWPAPGGVLRLYRGQLTWAAASAPMPAWPGSCMDLHRPGRYPLPAGQGCLHVTPARDGGVAVAKLQRVCLRPRAGGERFQLAAGGVPRSLKKQFQARAVPAWARGGPLLWAADGTLLFVPGLGIDARAAAAAGTPQLMLAWEPPALD